MLIDELIIRWSEQLLDQTRQFFFNHRTGGRPIPLAGHRLQDLSIRKKYSEKLTNDLNKRPFLQWVSRPELEHPQVMYYCICKIFN